MKKINIMIVEDESIIALNIKETLLELGYSVIGIASDAEKAHKLLSEYKPDLILMDIFLRNGDNGIVLAKEINEMYACPIIYLTANHESKTIAEASKSAPYGYMVKPFKYQDLHSTIVVALERFKHDRSQKYALDTIKNINASLKNKIEENSQSKTKIVALKYGYLYDRVTRILYHAEEQITLTERERCVIDILCMQLGHIVSIEQIELAAWKNKPAGYGSLRSLLFRLRSKLPKDLITNESGSGYRINKA